MVDRDEILLSIYVATYNHEKFIARALDSILMQKTKYKFEVLVGEDLSTDGTRAILKEYEKQHPGFFTIFYREKNMHNTECSNAQDLRARCKGKYLIALEGDDFWLDEYKLEKQIDFLETHPEYIAVAHNCVVVDKDSEINGESYPECTDEEYTFQHFFNDILPGQLTTVMYRNYLRDETFDSSILFKKLSPDDRLLYFALLCHGKIHCMQEVMSAYRHITNEGSSFSATAKFVYDEQKRWQKELLAYTQKHCKKNEIIQAEYLYFYIILWAMLTKRIKFKQAISDFSDITHKVAVFAIGLKRFINKKLLRKKVFAKKGL
ncbi:MAG: glycosyltransferase [Clostridia bacterium]|nr:glycosyltransferase [Clostridia bacterium]MBQ7095800.1 glycosyltransferase [Clostridia bacterium]